MRAGLVGSGIGPSLTPELHEREGRAQEIDYRYERFDTSSGRWKGVSLSEILDHTEKRSFAGLNIAHDGTPRDVGNIVRDFGLEITLFQLFRDFECLPEPLRSKAFDRMKRKVDVMQELGQTSC